MFFACGKGGTMATDKLLSEIVSLCYPDRASVNKKSLKLKETDKEYCFNSFGNAWESKYNTHVVDYVLITPTYVY